MTKHKPNDPFCECYDCTFKGCDAHKVRVLDDNPNKVIEKLINELKADCNRYANGVCTTLYCLNRGGYKRPNKPDYEASTCEKHEQVKAIESLMHKDFTSKEK